MTWLWIAIVVIALAVGMIIGYLAGPKTWRPGKDKEGFGM